MGARPRLPVVSGGYALFAGALFALASGVIGMRRRRGGGRRKASLEATARDRLRHLRYQVVETTGQAGSLHRPVRPLLQRVSAAPSH